jgi:hypothetical protein
MSKRAAEYDSILKTIQLYIDGTYEGDVAKLRRAFHEKASLSGYIDVPNAPPGGVLMVAPMDALYGYMATAKSPKAENAGYAARVGEITIRGNLARVVVYEDALGGHDYVNDLQLHRVADRWVITSKAFVADSNQTGAESAL